MDKAPPFSRRKSIKTVGEELLASEVLFVAGGYDRYGHQIAIFPNKADDLLSGKFTSANVVMLIRYYYTLCYHGKQTRGMAFVANLHQWKKTSIEILVEALDMAQDAHQGIVGVLYAHQPRKKELQKQFKKLTGLRTSKRNPKTACYQTVCVNKLSELFKFMDIRHLTEDFGGSLKYNHKAWITFMKTMDDLEENINKTLDKLPEAHDKISMMCQYDIPASQSEAELLLSQIRVKYQAIMRDLNLEHLIDECKEVVHGLTDPYIKPEYTEIMHTPSFCDARNNIEQYKKQLIRSREELKNTWQKAECRLILMARVVKYKKKAEQILSWLDEVGLPTVKEPAEIADCLSKAEMLKTQYEAGFHSIAKNVLWLSEKIQKKLDEAVMENKSLVAEILPFSRKFQESIEQFRTLTLSKYKVYLNIHEFYLTSHKLAGWYRRTLRFLPVQFLHQQPISLAGFTDVTFHGGAAWDAAVANYLLHHPPPKMQQLIKLKNILPVIDRIKIRSQARLLVHRIGILCTLLDDCSKVKLPDMQGILRWRSQVLDGLDDITLNLNGSVLDVGDQNVDLFDDQPCRPLSAASIKIAPKLKTPSCDGDNEYYSLDRNVAHRDKGSRRQHAAGRMPPKPASVPHLDLSFMDQMSQASEQTTETDSGRDMSNERYVSLGYVNNSGLPSSLKHIDMKVFQDGNASFITPSSERQVDKENMSSYQENQVLPQQHHQSAPNLKSALKPLSKITMDDVLKSNLDPEEKLDIMSKICSGDFQLSAELYYKLKPDAYAIETAKPQRCKYKRTAESATLPRPHKIQNSEAEEKHRSQRLSYLDQPNFASDHDIKHYPWCATSSWSGVKDSVEPVCDRKGIGWRSKVEKDSSKQSLPYNTDSGYSDNSHNLHQSWPAGMRMSDHGRSLKGLTRAKVIQHGPKEAADHKVATRVRKKPLKKSSIKVEEWMQRPEHQLEMKVPEKGQRSKVKHDVLGSLNQEEGLMNADSCPSLPLVRTDDLHVAESSLADTDTEGSDIDIVDKQLTELSLEGVSLDQIELEASLQKTEQILKEQEQLLKEYDLDLPASPSSLSSSSTLLNEDALMVAEIGDQHSCPVDVDDTSLTTERDSVRQQLEGSFSEESGVYVQSTDWRPPASVNLAYAGSRGSLNQTQPTSSPLTSDDQASGCKSIEEMPEYTDEAVLPREGHRTVKKEASWGDSSSQATVLTNVYQDEPLSSAKSKLCARHHSDKHSGEKSEMASKTSAEAGRRDSYSDLGNAFYMCDLDCDCSLTSDYSSTSHQQASMLSANTSEEHCLEMISACSESHHISYHGNQLHVVPLTNSPVPFSCLNNEVLGFKMPVVPDNRSGMHKCGLGNQDRPSVVFPTVEGRTKYQELMSCTYQNVCVGDAAQAMKDVLKLTHPHHTLTNCDDLEKLLQEQGYNLRAATEPTTVKDLREQLSFVTQNPAAELNNAVTSVSKQVNYTLPDEQQILLASESFRCNHVAAWLLIKTVQWDLHVGV